MCWYRCYYIIEKSHLYMTWLFIAVCSVALVAFHQTCNRIYVGRRGINFGRRPGFCDIIPQTLKQATRRTTATVGRSTQMSESFYLII